MLALDYSAITCFIYNLKHMQQPQGFEDRFDARPFMWLRSRKQKDKQHSPWFPLAYFSKWVAGGAYSASEVGLDWFGVLDISFQQY